MRYARGIGIVERLVLLQQAEQQSHTEIDTRIGSQAPGRFTFEERVEVFGVGDGIQLEGAEAESHRNVIAKPGTAQTTGFQLAKQ